MYGIPAGEFEQAERLQVVYDDDSPKMTKDMLSQFQRMNSVVVPVSAEDSRKIKEFGKDYKRIRQFTVCCFK